MAHLANLLTVAVLAVGCASPALASVLTWLPVSGSQNTHANAISSDGSVVVGEALIGSDYLPFMWENGAPTQLPGVFEGTALGISRDGRYIVGNGARFTGGADNNATRWDRTGLGQVTFVNLGSYSGNTISGNNAWAASNTGRVVGYQNQAALLPPIAWLHQAGGGYSLPPEGYNSSKPLRILDISADGTIYAGNYLSDATIWVDGVRSALPVRAGSYSAGVMAISADGRFAVGERYLDSFESEAFLYGPSGLVVIGRLPGDNGSVAYDVSDDGSVVVGDSSFRYAPHAFVWTQSAGIRDLNDLLASAGVPTNGAVFYEATGISGDGRYVTGTAFTPGGATAFILDLTAIPEPGLASLALGTVAFFCRRRNVLRGRKN